MHFTTSSILFAATVLSSIVGQVSAHPYVVTHTVYAQATSASVIDNTWQTSAASVASAAPASTEAAVTTSGSSGPIATGASRPVVVINKCSFDVHLLGIFADVPTEKRVLAAGQQSTYNTPSVVDSANIKVSLSADISSPLQFEWSNKDLLYYDISLIDGNPLLNHGGEAFLPQNSQNCNNHVVCGNGDYCSLAYHNPPDPATWSCSNQWDSLHLVLCSTS